MADLNCGAGGSSGHDIVTAINANTLAIEALQALNSYYHDSNENTLDITDSYTNIGNLAVTNLVAGEYLIGISATYKLDITNKSVYTQFSLNGGTAEEFSKEPKDSTDREGFTYVFPYAHVSGDFSLILDMKKEDSNGTLDCLFSNVWLDRRS